MARYIGFTVFRTGGAMVGMVHTQVANAFCSPTDPECDSNPATGNPHGTNPFGITETEKGHPHVFSCSGNPHSQTGNEANELNCHGTQ